MEPHEIAAKAVESTIQYKPILSREIRYQLACGWIASEWLLEHSSEPDAAKLASAAVACVGSLMGA